MRYFVMLGMWMAMSCDTEDPGMYRAYLLTRTSWKISSIEFSEQALAPLATPSLGSSITFRADHRYEITNDDFVYDFPAEGSWHFTKDESELILDNHRAFKIISMTPISFEIKNPHLAGSSVIYITYKFSTH